MSDYPAWWGERPNDLSEWRPRTLRQKQTLFLACIATLTRYAHACCWELTPSDFAVDEGRIEAAMGRMIGGKRPLRGELRRAVGHLLGGCHTMKLAGDVNLFVKGRMRRGACSEWDALGAFWKGLNPRCRWGGDFASQDYNHFSITHGGRS